MSFKKLRGVPLPEEKQGLVRYTCLTYAEQPKRIQDKIERLCHECGGEHWHALFLCMTTKRSIVSIAMEEFVSESAIYRMRKAFYREWYRRK